MDLPRRDVKISFLCHVATLTSHVATSKSHASVTSRRVFSRRDVKIPCLCHVATCIFTSRRQLAKASVTSRRVFSRRDLKLYQPLSRRNVDSNVATLPSAALCHVATLPRTSRCHFGLRPRSVHFLALHLTSLSTATLAPSRTILALPCRSSFRPGRRPLHCSPTTVSHPLWPVLGHSGISTTVCPTLAWVQ